MKNRWRNLNVLRIQTICYFSPPLSAALGKCILTLNFMVARE